MTRALLVLALLSVPSFARAQTLSDGAPKDNFSVSTHVASVPELTDFRFLPDGRVVMTLRRGDVRVRAADGTVVTAATMPVAFGHPEQGLLGLEVHPDFAANRTLFLYYSLSDAAGGTALDRHRVVSITLGDDNKLDLASEKVLVRDLRGPANHNGGGLALSNDRAKLFIGVGDTGCNSGKQPEPPYAPTNFFGTCLTNANGKILRINLDGSIPDDNPLAATATVTACGATCGTIPTTLAAPRRDIWAWGFRNPWRLWVDPATSLLWVGDVGEVSYEEVNVVEGGKHYGWPWREGAHGHPTSKCRETTPSGDCIDPVHECAHDGSTCKSINGGMIVDACDWPEGFRGRYFFADNVTGAIWTLQPTADRRGVVPGSRRDFGSAPGPVSLRLGPDRAIYVASFAGKLVRFAPNTLRPCAVPDADVPDVSGVDAGDAGTDSVGTLAPPDDGCGCSVPRSAAMRHPLLLVLAGLLIRRRRR